MLNNVNFKSAIALKTSEAHENISCWSQKCTIARFKAHIGTEGNEAADKPARKRAENNGNMLPTIKTPSLASTSKEIIVRHQKRVEKKTVNSPSLQIHQTKTWPRKY